MTEEAQQERKTRQIRIKLHSIILVESRLVRDQKDFAQHYLVPGIENNSLGRQLKPVILGLNSESMEQILAKAYEHMSYQVHTEFIIVVRPQKDRGQLVKLLGTAAREKAYNIDSVILRGDASDFDISVTDIGLYDSMWLDMNKNYVVLKDCKAKTEIFIREVMRHGFEYNQQERKLVPSNGQSSKTVFIFVKGLFRDSMFNDTIGEIIFNSSRHFLIIKDPNFSNKLFQVPESIPGELSNSSREFFRDKGIVVTYGACRLKFLGKVDKESLKMQQGFDPHVDDEQDDWPVHFYGPLEESFRYIPNNDD